LEFGNGVWKIKEEVKKNVIDELFALYWQLLNVFIMKKVFVLLCVLGAVLSSCIIEDVVESFYKIINQSSQDIKINISKYDISSTVSYDTTFYIPKNQQLEFMERGEPVFPFGGLLDNTAFIIFNDSDTLLYTREDNSSRNILEAKNYSTRTVKKKHSTIYYCTYTFTEEDYQNAVNSKKKMLPLQKTLCNFTKSKIAISFSGDSQ